MKLEVNLPFDMPLDLPPVYPVRQKFEDRALPDVGEAMRRAIAGAKLFERLRPGTEVAITAGSRGIDRITEVLRETGRCVRDAGGAPFIVPAMGSHGGATAEGQVELLAELGITEESAGMPIRSSMETVEIARTALGIPVYVDRIASEAGAILVINRVKIHTSFVGPHQSGIIKMLAVGLGKRDGAMVFHRGGVGQMARWLPQMAGEMLARLPVIGGIGLLEDSFDHLAEIRAVRPDDFLEADHEMLEMSATLLPRIPFNEIDVLVVDEIGKDISGTGMDSNVIGRRCIRLEEGPPGPRIARIVALDLTEKTKGNAHGVGMADMVTERLVQRIDWQATRANALTTRFPEKAMLPLSFTTAAEAIAAAIATCWTTEPEKVRLVRIKNTRDLDRLLVSETLLGYVKANPNLEIVGPAEPLLK